MSVIHFPSCLRQLLGPDSTKHSRAGLHLDAAASRRTWKRIPPPCASAGNSGFGHFTKTDTEVYFSPLCHLPAELPGLLGEGERPAGTWKSVSSWDASLAWQDPKRCPAHGKDPSATAGISQEQGLMLAAAPKDTRCPFINETLADGARVSPGRVTAICIPACNSACPLPQEKGQIGCTLQPPTRDPITWVYISPTSSALLLPEEETHAGGRGTVGLLAPNHLEAQ